MGENTTGYTKGLILVVEDSYDIRLLLGQIFEDEGYQVISAEDGQSAIDKAKLYHPSLILMDMALPGLSGWKAVELLRQIDEFKQTPIIAVTAHAFPKDEERAMAVGCTAYVSKPFDIVSLLEQIDSFKIKN